MADKQHKITNDINSVSGLKFMSFMGMGLPNPVPIPLGIYGLEKYNEYMQGEDLTKKHLNESNSFNYLSLNSNNTLEQSATDFKRSQYFEKVRQEIMAIFLDKPSSDKTLESIFEQSPIEQEKALNKIKNNSK